MQNNNRVIPRLLCLLCALALLSAWSFAADPVDPGREVSLTIEYLHDKQPISGAQFDLYFVADIDENANLTLTGDFRGYPVKLDDSNAETWKALAEMFAVYVERDGLKPIDSGKTGETGTLYFPNQQESLKSGLYLVVGRRLVQETHTYMAEPFLVTLPTMDQDAGTWSYGVLAAPKFTVADRPDEPSDETVERCVLKIWKDDLAEIRPQEVTIQLLRDGTIYDTVLLNEANGWRHAWQQLPKYNEDGSEIVWKVAEDELEGYTVLIAEDGISFTVTNTFVPEEPSDETVSRTVQKVWDDHGYENRRPDSIHVTLLQNGADYDTQTLNAANNWQYTWNKLPKCDQNNEEIKWTIREDNVSGYRVSVTLNGTIFVLTNTYREPGIPQTGQLWWPVPLLAAIGLVFLIVGVLLRKKREAK